MKNSDLIEKSKHILKQIISEINVKKNNPVLVID